MSYYIFSETLVQMTEPSIKLIGNPGSPYTRKMIAYLRYKRIPHSVIWGEASDVLKKMNIDPPKPILLPVFLLPRDGKVTAVTDSTPLIEEFENSYPDRSVYPEDPSLRFINYVLEDLVMSGTLNICFIIVGILLKTLIMPAHFYLRNYE